MEFTSVNFWGVKKKFVLTENALEVHGGSRTPVRVPLREVKEIHLLRAFGGWRCSLRMALGYEINVSCWSGLYRNPVPDNGADRYALFAQALLQRLQSHRENVRFRKSSGWVFLISYLVFNILVLTTQDFEWGPAVSFTFPVALFFALRRLNVVPLPRRVVSGIPDESDLRQDGRIRHLWTKRVGLALLTFWLVFSDDRPTESRRKPGSRPDAPAFSEIRRR